MRTIRAEILLIPLILVFGQRCGGQERATTPGLDEAKTVNHAVPMAPVTRIGTHRFRHDGDLWLLSFSPDGKILAGTSRDGQIVLWDTGTGKELQRLVNKDGDFPSVFAIDFSPDGKRVASRWSDQSLRIFEAATAKEILKIPLDDEVSGGRRQVCFAADGKVVMVNQKRFDVRLNRAEVGITLYDSTSGKECGKLDVLRGHVGPFALSSNGKVFTARAGGNLPNVEVWDTATWRKSSAFAEHEFVNVLTLFPNGGVVASAGQNQIVVSDVTNQKSLGILKTPIEIIIGLAFTPDVKTLISVSGDHKLTLWDLNTMKESARATGPRGQVRSVALSPDGATLAVGGAFNVIHLWNLRSGREPCRRFQGPEAEIDLVEFSSDGKLLATGGNGQEVCIWSIPSGRQHMALKNSRGALGIAFSSDGKLLTTISPNSDVIRIWDVATGEIKRELRRVSLGGAAVLFSPDERSLITGHFRFGMRRTILNTWDVHSATHLGEYSLAIPNVRALACSEDRSTVALGTTDGTIVTVDVRSGKESCRIRGHLQAITSLAFSRRWRVMSSASMDRSVRVWDLMSGKEVLSFRHRRPITSVGFSPDSRICISSTGGDARDGEGPQGICFWETATGMEITCLQEHNSGVQSLSLSPDGRYLAAALRDGTALVWDITTLLYTVGLQSRALKADDVERFWNDLSQLNSPKAYRAISALAADPESSMPFLKRQLTPVQAVDRDQLWKWIADFDSDLYAVRNAASSNLKRLAQELIETEVRKALQANPSLEARRRLEELFQNLGLLDRRIPYAAQGPYRSWKESVPTRRGAYYLASQRGNLAH